MRDTLLSTSCSWQLPPNAPARDPPCSASFVHSCHGVCRVPYKHWLPVSQASHRTWQCGGRTTSIRENDAGLRALLRATASRGGQCTLAVTGDSIMHDVWSALVSGAIRLGERLLACDFNAGHSGWLEAERSFCGANKSRAERLALPRQALLSSHATFSTDLVLHSPRGIDRGSTASRSASKPVLLDGSPRIACAKLTIAYHESFMARSVISKLMRGVSLKPAGDVLSSASLVILGGGTHANSVEDLVALADTHLRPYLAALDSVTAVAKATTARAPGAAVPSAGVRLLWLETPPQHFPSHDGSGSYSYSAVVSQRRCVPVTNQTLAAWRNKALDKWAEQHWPSSGGGGGGGVARAWQRLRLFDLLLPRHGMHGVGKPDVGPDCTHYCYAAAMYEPLWRRAARFF